MPAASKTYTLELRARDQAEKVLKALGRTGFREARRLAQSIDKVEGELKQVERAGSRVSKVLGGGFQKLTSFLRGSFIPAILASVAAFGGFQFLKGIAANASEFQIALAEINTILPETSKGVLDLRKETTSLAVATGELETVVARGLYQTISAGVTDAADALTVLGSASRLAVGGVSNTAATVDVLTSVINAYQFEAEQADRISDILFTTVRQGKTTVDQLASSIAQALPQAALLGVEFEEVAAAVATLTKQGFTTSEAVTNLAALFRSLSKRSEDVDKAVRKIGSRFSDQTFKTRALNDVLNELATVVAGSTSRAFGILGARAEAANALFGLTGRNAKVLAGDLEAVRNSAGNAGRAFEEIAGTPAFKVIQAQEALRVGWLELGDAILLAVSRGVESIGGLGAVTATVENIGRRLEPLITGLISALFDFSKGFVVTAEDIELATARTKLWVLEVRALAEEIRGVVQWWKEVFTIGDEAGREFALLARTFDPANLDGREIDRFAREIGVKFRDALDNEDLFAVRVRDEFERISQITRQLAAPNLLDTLQAGLDPAELRKERTQLLQEVARQSLRLGDLDKQTSVDKLAALEDERQALLENVAILERETAEKKIAVGEAMRAAEEEERRAAAAESRQRLLNSLRTAVPTDPRAAALFQVTGIALADEEMEALVGRAEELADVVGEKLVNAWNRLTIAADEHQQTLDQEKAAEEIILSLRRQTATTEADKRAVAVASFEALEKEIRSRTETLDLTTSQTLQLNQQLALLREMAEAGPMTPDTRVADLQKELDALGEGPARAMTNEAINSQFEQREASIDALEREGMLTADLAEKMRGLNATRTNDIIEAEKQRRATERTAAAFKAFGDGALRSVEASLLAVATGSQSTKEAFRGLVRSLVTDLIRLGIRLLITNGLLALFDGLTLGTKTALAVQNAGTVAAAAQAISNVPAAFAMPAAEGAFVDRPTLALIGEAGPEAVVPLSGGPGDTPGALPLGTGLRQSGMMLGGGGGNTTIQPVIVIQAIDTQTGLGFLENNAEAIASQVAAQIGFQADITDAVRGQGGGVPGTF